MTTYDQIRCLDCNVVLAVVPSDHYFRWTPGYEPTCIYVHRIHRSAIPQVEEPPFYAAEDDEWFDCVPRIWFDGDRCKVTVTGYRIDDGAWITLRRPLAVAGIPMIGTEPVQ